MTTSQPRQIADRETIERDPHRPQYHFLPAQGWMNDPNGLIHWKGSYHLFYQHNPHGAWHDTVHWGHAASTDLVHWTDLPIALTPTPGSPDEDGCWSGCAVGDHGVPTIIYTGVQGEAQLPCLATSDDDLRTWHKYAHNPIIAEPPPDADIIMFRDHSLWNEAGTWYQVIGSGIKDRGGTALLYRSDDLLHWDYLHPLYVGDKDRTSPISTGLMWECPDFFALGDRHALIVSLRDHIHLFRAAIFVGQYEQHRFTPTLESLLDFGGSFYAPQSLKDSAGRRLMWGWLREQRGIPAQRAAGWSGVMSLPRLLSLTPHGDLMMQPVPQLQMLRREHYHCSDLLVEGDVAQILEGVEGVALEIIAEFEPNDAEMLGLLLCRSPDGAEETRVIFDCQRQRLAIDTQRSSLNGDVDGSAHGGDVPATSDGLLRLHVFLDHSVVEVFINDLACVTARIYPSRLDSVEVGLYAEGGPVQLRSIDVWHMESIWEDRASPGASNNPPDVTVADQ